ncbi:MAG: MBL fold metallo-hydrolase [Candidatus Micrarchaeia archaeon]
MKMILAGLIVLVLLFGCTGGGEQRPPANNTTNVTNQTPPVHIIIGNQTNQTTGANITKNETGNQTGPTSKELDYTYDPTKLMAVYFIDVGGPGEHGDAILVKKGDFDMLIDAGPADNSGKVVDFLHDHGVDDIEVLVSTTGDPRRYGGIKEVAKDFKIEHLWWGGDDFGDQGYKSAIAVVKSQVKEEKTVQEGFQADLDGMNVTVLNPPKAHRFEDVNNDAIVMRLVEGNISMLLTSGIQTGAQGLLINTKKSEIQTLIMQAPYYGVGSGTSNIGIFLITAKPKYMIITGSSDESAPNGGSREPFQRQMVQYNITPYMNYVNGTIRITTDGNNFTAMALGSGQ